MTCKEYSIDISAIEEYIEKIKDASIKEQIYKKIRKVKENPYTGESKRYKLRDFFAVKVNKQRVVILYRFSSEDPCLIIFIDINSHDDAYRNTF